MARILIVDDEKSIRRTLGEFLRDDGYEVVEAEDADAAQQRLREAEFDVVVSDIILPRVTGVELLRRIHSTAPRVQVVMMTGEPTVETASEALRAGATDYLFKPITKAAILRVVANAARIKSLDDAKLKLEAENHAHQENLERLVNERTAQLRASEERALELSRFSQATLDALTADICVLAQDGTILAVNESWRQRAATHQPLPANAGVGANYLAVCEAVVGEEAATARELARGLRAVALGDSPEFSLEYPCHAPAAVQWFYTRATRFAGAGPVRIVVAHLDTTARKQAELELAHSHELYRRAITAANAIPYQKDYGSDTYVFVGDGIKEATGYAPEELHSAVWQEMILETVLLGDAAGLTKDEASRRVVAGQLNSWRADYRIRTRSGEIRWISDSSVSLRAADGAYLGSLGILQDITMRKQAEESLRAERTLLRTLVDHLPVAVYVKDAAARKTLANPPDVRNLGAASEAEALGKTDYDLFPREQAERFWADDQQVLQTGRPVLNREEFLTRPDGTTAWLLTSKVPLCDATGRVTGLVGIGLDITERRQAMEQLRTLALAVEHSPASIVITDRKGNIEFVNPKFTQITGYTAEEVLGKNPRILKSGETPEEEYRRLWETITADKEWRGEFHNKRKDGTLFWESASISSIRDASGEITHFVCVKEDVTEQKKLEVQFLRAQRMESVGRLAGGIAHDLNNILAPILMGASLLRAGLPPKEAKTLIDTIAGSAQRGADIVKQLLIFARGTEGQKLALPSSRLVKDMAKIVQETFPKSIELHTQIPKDLWTVTGDPTQLHQVLLNLCVNARDAMPKGGTLTLAAENVTLDACYTGMNPGAKAGPYVVLQVSDTGTGMPREIMDNIFDPFFTTKGPQAGTGLGLATVQGIVKSHDGFIQVESEVGRGSRFKIYLPAQPGVDAAATATPGGELPRGRGELVLVVDDEQNVRDITRRILEQHRYRVLTADNGTGAVALYAQQQAEIQVVLTDMMMPVMDGAATVHVLRGINPQVKIIVASGASSKVKPEEFPDLSAQAYLQKPFTAQTLLVTLDQVLHGEQTHGQGDV